MQRIGRISAKRLLALLLTLAMLLSAFPLQVLALEEGEETPAAAAPQNGYVEEIYFPVSFNKSMTKTLECIQDSNYTFEQDTCSYDVVLPEQPTETLYQGNGANYFGIKIPEELVSSTDPLCCHVTFDGELKTWNSRRNVASPKKLSSQITRIDATAYMKNVKAGEWHTMEVTVGKLKAGSKEEFDSSDTYTFRLTRQASLLGLTGKAGENDLTFSPAPDFTDEPYVRDYSVVAGDAEEITLKLTATDGATVKIGETDVTEQVTAKTDITVGLSGYRSSADAALAIVPITVQKTDTTTAEGAKATTETTYRLIVSKVDYVPEITSQPQNIDSTEKNADPPATLSVTATAVGGTLSYQWYRAETYSATKIQGATESTYTPPHVYAGTQSYYCVVTNTVDGVAFTAQSETASVTVNLTYLTAPQLPKTMEIEGNSGKKVFFENGAPTFKVWIGKALNGTADDAEGLTYSVSVYRTDKPESSGGELQATQTVTTMEDGSGFVYFVALPSQTVTGKQYYYAVVTVSKEGYESAERAGEPVALTFKTAADVVTELEGSGSVTDPYLIYDQEDLEYVKSLVEGTDGQAFSFSGQTLAFANDITLDKNWSPIGGLKAGGEEGDLGVSLLPFCGTLDGRGYTVTVADHGKCLFQYVRNATVKNLNIQGDHIDGYALVDGYVVDYGEDGTYISQTAPKHRTIDIENVTLKSGTQTLQSGFIGGVASGANAVNIRNCVIEKGVVIGYDHNQSYIGSFAGNFNGTIENSVSYATVYGVDGVGGLAGQKGQSMGSCDFLNCAFLGKVEATGTAVGGIIGAGYPSASGTPMVQVHNCYVAADITGKDRVGGIIGAEAGHTGNVDAGDVYGVMGTTSVTDTHYYGTLTAIAENAAIGGIVGYMRDFAKKAGEATNYFLAACGAENSIGAVQTGEIVGAERYGVSGTADEFQNSTIVKKLNASESGFSYKNWVQGDDYPVFSSDPVVMSLTISGSCQTRYTLGEDTELNLDGLTFTAKWSDGKTTDVRPADANLTHSAFDPNTMGEQEITFRYGAATASITVTVVKNYTEEEKEDFGEATVLFTLTNDNSFVTGADEQKTLLANQPITIRYFDLDLYDLASFYCIGEDGQVIEQPTVLHLFITALERYKLGLPEEECGKGKLKEVMDENKETYGNLLEANGKAGSFYMKHFWGHDENLIYFVDGDYPLQAGSEKTGNTADQILLKDVEYVDLAMFTDWSFYQDASSGFRYFTDESDPTAPEKEFTLIEGENLTLTCVTAHTDMESKAAYNPVEENVPVYYSKTMGDPAAKQLPTDSDGNITFGEETDGLTVGTWYLWTDGGRDKKGTVICAPASAILVVKTAARNVEDLINAIGDEITLDSQEAIEAARDAYDALNEEEKEAFEDPDSPGYSSDKADLLAKLQAAEEEYAALKAAKEAEKDRHGSHSGTTNYYVVHTYVNGEGTIDPCGTTGSVMVKNGSSKTFTFTPAAGYEVADVLVSNKSIGAVTSYTFSNIDHDKNLEVTFVKSANTAAAASSVITDTPAAKNPNTGAVWTVSDVLRQLFAAFCRN